MTSKLVKRILLKDKKLFIAINFVFLLFIIFMTISIYSFSYGLENYNTYTEKTNLEDFSFTTYEEFSKNDIFNLEEKYSLNLEKENRYKYENKNYQINIYPYEGIEISKPIITDGIKEISSGEILLSQEFATENDYIIGDYLQIEDKSYEIVGLVSVPELMYPTKDGELIPSNSEVGVGYITPKDFSKNYTNIDTFYRGKFNTELTKSDREIIYENIKKEKVIEIPNFNIVGQIKDLSSTVEISNIKTLIDKTENISLNIIRLEYQFLGLIIGGLSLIILVIALTLIVFLFRSIIKNNKRELGIVIAEGVTLGELIFKFQIYFGISLIISSVIGLISAFFMIYGLENIFTQFFNIIKYSASLVSIIVIVLSLILFAIVVLLIVQYFVIYSSLSKSTLSLVKNIEIEKVNVKELKQISKLSFKNKLKMNILLRNRGKTLILVYGVVFSSLLILFALLMLNSITHLEDNILGDNFSYDYTVTYSQGYEVNPKLYDQNSTINIIGDLININGEEVSKDNISLLAYNSQNNDYIDFELEESLNGEVLVSEVFSKKYNVKAGDNIIIANPINHKEAYTFKIKEVVDVLTDEKVYADINDIQNKLGLEDDYYNGLVGKGKDKSEISQGDKEMIYYSNNDLFTSMNSYSALMNVAIIYLIVLALAISFIIIISITNIILTSNKKTISTMKVLGYSSKEINNLLLSYYKWIVLVIYTIMYPVSIVLIRFYISFIIGLIPDVNYPIIITGNIWIFVGGLVFIFGLYMVTVKLSIRKIDKIKLSESLKVDE